ncbi:MAG TPA: calcium-binding protein [Solirubrobacterales bacterium]|nr:calcium-binding protein [Solirubrobacterales bacterium]
MRHKGLVALVLAAALALIWAPAGASPESQIVVQGTASGSHLRLSVSDNRLYVAGWMSPLEPIGCNFERYRRVAVCPLASAGAVEIDMGSENDVVEVLDPLPVPLTAHLGDGSDRFIGNSEPDTCYSEGARRNRCIGGDGDDICITGKENSDCVGDAGDDYCQTGAGSDGCWGGPGNDVCRMGPGQDGCHGESGADRLFGGPGRDQLYGGPSYDHCDGLPGWGRSHGCETGPRS